MRRAVVAMLALLAGRAEARDAEPQLHEVRADLDVDVEQGANAALVDAQYTFSFGGIDKNDGEPPFLRRYLTHPSSVWFHVRHDGGTREAITSFELGGELDPWDGVVYARIEGGVGRHLTIYDEPEEFGYYFAAVSAEIGFRPINLVQIGLFYDGRPILGADTDTSLPSAMQAQRSGLENRAGLTASFVTPTERIFASVSGFFTVDDWSFKNLNPGDITVRGFGGSVRLAYLTSLTTTLQLHATLSRDHWVDERLGDGDPTFVGPNLDRQVWTFDGGLDLFFWPGNRYGFRVSAGGGYHGAPTFTNFPSTGLFSFGGGLLLRF
jgi:hypothetical protein